MTINPESREAELLMHIGAVSDSVGTSRVLWSDILNHFSAQGKPRTGHDFAQLTLERYGLIARRATETNLILWSLTKEGEETLAWLHTQRTFELFLAPKSRLRQSGLSERVLV
jgi:hypothetical protein